MEKSPHSAEEEALTRKLLAFIADELDLDETVPFPFPEERVQEMMQELYKEIERPASPAAPSPISPDAAPSSTVISGIDVAGSGRGFPVTQNEVAVVDGGNGGDALALLGFGEEDFYDEGDIYDYEWLGRVLN